MLTKYVEKFLVENKDCELTGDPNTMGDRKGCSGE